MTDLAAAVIPVLVVDDSAVSRKLLEHALEGQHYDVFFARDAAEALRVFERHSPRIVITDWMLPDLSGPDLCRKIRASSRSYTYLLILTSNADKDSVVEGLAAGADDYVTKPFDKQELQARIGVGRRIIELHTQIALKNRELEQLARTDHLTGLPNRRAVEDYGQRNLSSATRHKFPLWLIVIDLDEFKSVNDGQGHAVGDAVLIRVAEILRRNTRSADVCGRLGGDKFILVVSYAGQSDVAATAERLLSAIAAEEFAGLAGPFRMTASFGMAGFHGSGTPEFKELLMQADAALYAAKAAGRSSVKIYANNTWNAPINEPPMQPASVTARKRKNN